MKKVLFILLLIGAFLLAVKSCFFRSHRFSPSYSLQESRLDGMPWYSIVSRKEGEMDDPPFCQLLDGIQQEGDKIYLWVNGSAQPDFYVLDTGADTCTPIGGPPPHIRFVSPRQFLGEH